MAGGSLFSSMNANVLGMRAISQKMSNNAQNLASAGAVAAKERGAFISVINGDTNINSFTPAGVQAHNFQNISSVGPTIPSDVSTHMALTGQGMFIVNNSPNDATPGKFGFTRVGTFEVDKDGNFRNHAGQYLKVFYTNAQGVIQSTNTATLTGLETASINGLSGAPQASTSLGVKMILKGDAAVNDTYATQATIFDSLGISHTLTLHWTKTAEVAGTNQTWNLRISCPDAAAAPGGVQAPYNTAPGMAIVFDSNGHPLTFNGAATPPPNLNITWAGPAANTTLALNLGAIGESDGVVTAGTTYDPGTQTVNGRQVGKFQSASINDKGQIFANYDNGQTEQFAVIPLATFANVNRLLEQTGGVYYTTAESGSYTLSLPNQGAAGGIASSNLEESDIDPVEIFTQMIVDQKRYTANLRGISTVEKMLDALERILGG